MKNVQIINHGVKINGAESENTGSRCGGPSGFPSVNRLVTPRICVSSAVMFTHWFLARVKCLHMTL